MDVLACHGRLQRMDVTSLDASTQLASTSQAEPEQAWTGAFRTPRAALDIRGLHLHVLIEESDPETGDARDRAAAFPRDTFATSPFRDG